MSEPEDKHSGNELQLDLCQPRSKTNSFTWSTKDVIVLNATNESGQLSHTSAPPKITERRFFGFLPSRVEFPRVWVNLRIEVDITKRINNIGTGGYYFVVDINFWTNITPHSGVRLGNACRFPNNSVKDWS